MKLRTIALALLVVAGSLSAARAGDEPGRHWVAGDLHEHVTPPDTTDEVSATFSACVEQARAGELTFLAFTPHLRGDWWRDPVEARRDLAALEALAARAAGVTDLCLIPGYEDTRRTGHVGVSFLDSSVFAAVLEPGERTHTRGEHLETLARAGALLTINHPLQGTNPHATIPEMQHDMSWAPWTKPGADADAERIEAAAGTVEVLNAGLSMAESATGVPVGERLIDRTFALLDRRTLASGRRLSPVGGSDNHAFWLVPTTWVSVPDRGKLPDGRPVPPTVAEVKDALLHGRTCVGGPEAGTLRVGVAGSEGPWIEVGGEIAAAGRALEARWEGEGELFVDGKSVGKFDGGTRLSVARGSRHHLRLVRGLSWSGYVHVDWSEPAPRPRIYR